MNLILKEFDIDDVAIVLANNPNLANELKLLIIKMTKMINEKSGSLDSLKNEISEFREKFLKAKDDPIVFKSERKHQSLLHPKEISNYSIHQ